MTTTDRRKRQRLRRAARRLGDQYQLVFDFPTNRDWAVPPAFTSYTPTQPLRPSP